MEVYRICLEQYSKELFASGNRNRWNSRGNFVIYTAGSRALACLENVVHRSGEGLRDLFKIVVIEIPNQVLIESISIDDLPAHWKKTSSYSLCQPLGDAWYEKKTSAVLRVPSSIIAYEFNYVLNTRHADFSKIRIIRHEEFDFDLRIKSNDPEREN